jgi:bloom syndrome protein
MLVLTATANPRVRQDVLLLLNISSVKWFLSSFNRPNLRYIVLPKKGSSTVSNMITLIKEKFVRASGIIYCLSRKDCEMVATKLSLDGVKACVYHAGLSDKTVKRARIIPKKRYASPPGKVPAVKKQLLQVGTSSC